MTVPHDAVIIHEQAGAGGFGDPAARDPALVREDLLDGKISAGVRPPALRQVSSRLMWTPSRAGAALAAPTARDPCTSRETC